jgi:hypothetical protein
MNVFYGGLSPCLSNAYVSAARILGWDSDHLPIGERPFGLISEDWAFTYAWPICHWNRATISVFVWITAIPGAQKEDLLSLIRLQLLRRLRGGPTALFCVTPEQFKAQCKSNSFVGDSVSFIRPVSLTSMAEGLLLIEERDLIAKGEANAFLYRGCLARLVHQIKNGMFLSGESLRNNFSIATKIFAQLGSDFRILEDKQGEMLSSYSLNYVTHHEGEFTHLLKQWADFYAICAEASDSLSA